MTEYCIPAGPGEAEFTEKRSRFLGHLRPVGSEEEARAFIRASYPNGKEEDYLKYLESSGIDEFPIMLPNYKKMVMLWIEKPMI